MKARDKTVRQDVRPFGQGSTERGAIDPGAGETPDAAGGDKGEKAQRAILDATLACFAEYGWSGTNMSVIARRSRMTRGRIQYYYPTLDDLLRAAIDHLAIEWRRQYFGLVTEASGASARFETGVEVLWRLMQDPLHVAKQELEASARTNPQLRALMQQAATGDEETSVQAVKQAFPELAEKGDAAVRLARNFTMVFMEGLTLYRFTGDADARRSELIEMLKAILVSYWASLGVEILKETPRAKRGGAQVATPRRDDQRRERALALIQEAATLLSTG